MNKVDIDKPERVSRNTFKVSFWTLISRIFGVLRDITTTYLLGATVAHDIFVVMLKIPNLFRRLVAEGAFSQAFIPVFSEYKENKTKQELKDLLNSTFSMILSATSAICLVFMVFAPIAVLIFAPGFYFDPIKSTLATEILRIVFPYLFFVSVVAFFGSVLNTYGFYSVPAASPIAFNLSIIIFALFLSDFFNFPIYAIAWGVFFAGCFQLILNATAIAKIKLFPAIRLDFKNEGLKRILWLMLPAVLSGGVIQINILVDTIFASLLDTGSPTWLYLSDRLIQLPLGIFGIAVATVILPTLSKAVNTSDIDTYQNKFNWALKFVFLIGAPSAIGLYFLSIPIISTLFLRGEFSSLDVLMTSYSLQAFCFGLIAFMAIKILNAAFFSQQNTKTPLYIAIFSLCTNVFLNWYLAFQLDYGHIGLALGSAIASIISLLILFFILLRNSILILERSWFKFVFQILVSSIFLATFLTFVSDYFYVWTQLNLITQLGLLGLLMSLGIFIYFASMIIFGFKVSFFRE